METTPNPEVNKNSGKKASLIKWLRRVGVWGFLFFLVKGLVWLALGYWAFK